MTCDSGKENVLDNLSGRLGGLVLKEEQTFNSGGSASMKSGKDVMAVLPTGFGKSIIY